MSKIAREMKIPETDLMAAMILVRDFRLRAYTGGLDPRAVRIAIIYLNMADLHFARMKLTAKDLRNLEKIADEMFKEILRKNAF